MVIAGPRDEGLTGKALEKGALDFLPLPLDSTQTWATIERAIWIHQMRTTIRRREQLLLTIRRRREPLSLTTEHDQKAAAIWDKDNGSREDDSCL